MAANALRGLVLLGIPTHIALYHPNRIQKLLLNSQHMLGRDFGGRAMMVVIVVVAVRMIMRMVMIMLVLKPGHFHQIFAPGLMAAAQAVGGRGVGWEHIELGAHLALHLHSLLVQTEGFLQEGIVLFFICAGAK